MRSGSANAKVATVLDDQAFAVRRSIDYGGLVGDLLTEIESRMSLAPSAQTMTASGSVGVVHRVSIAAGYIGLAAGFVTAGSGIIWLIS